MLTRQLGLYIAVALLPPVWTLQTATSLDQLPACAQPCQDDVLRNASCSVDFGTPSFNGTPECYCANGQDVEHALISCIRKVCDLDDFHDWQKTRARYCGTQPRNISNAILVTCIVLFVVASISCLGRLLARTKRLGGPGFWWDDWAVVVLFINGIIRTAVDIRFHEYHVGIDAIGTTTSDIRGVLLWNYIDETFYLIGTFGTKLAFTLLYFRMWKTRGWIRYFCWFAACFSVVEILFGFLCCSISKFPWHYYLHGTTSVRVWVRVFSIPGVTYALGGFNILGDIYVLLLPIPMLLQLPGLPIERKLSIAFVFLFGFLATAVSVVRLRYIKYFIDSTNVTWDFGIFSLICSIEVDLSVMAVNLPTWLGLLRRVAGGLKRERLTSTADSNPEFNSIALSQVTTVREHPTPTSGEPTYKDIPSTELDVSKNGNPQPNVSVQLDLESGQAV